jgi:hypothetical protein
MSYSKTILCLANSRKPGGHCVAGLEVGRGVRSWVRPVSSRSTREISDQEELYRDGTLPSLLDVISIEFERPLPERHQQENHQIDDRQYWTKQRIAGWDEVATIVENVSGPLWVNGFSSTNGNNDRVPESCLGQFNRSLYLIRPDDFELHVAVEGAQFGDPKRRVRACLSMSGHEYAFAVTDPQVEIEYLAKPDGRYRIKEALITVSLGEVFHGFAYKLTAAVITPQRFGRRP